jgi:hypothetical protein
VIKGKKSLRIFNVSYDPKFLFSCDFIISTLQQQGKGAHRRFIGPACFLSFFLSVPAFSFMFFFSACFTLLTDILISLSVCVYGFAYGYGCQPRLFLVPDGVWRGFGGDWVWSSFFWLWEIPSGWVRIFVMVYVYQWCSLFLFFMVLYVCLRRRT